MRRLCLPLLLVPLCWGLGGLSPAGAQVVIRERVEVRPPGPEATGRTSDRIVGHWVYYAYDNPYEYEYAVHGSSGGNGVGGTLEVITSDSLVYSASIAGAFNSGTLEPYCGPSWSGGLSVTTAEIMRVPIYEGEGVAEHAVTIEGQRESYLGWVNEFGGRFGCWLGNSNSCDCLTANGASVKASKVYFRRVWEPVPPDHFAVGIMNSPLTPNQSAIISVVAQWSDSTEAPLWEGTPTTITASSSAYGYLQAWPHGGASVTLPYRSNYSASAGYLTYYYNPNVPRPVCDVPVEISASGGGLSGSATLMLRGSSTATVADTLIVTATPNSLEAGQQATIRATAQSVDGCDISEALPDTTAMTVSLSSSAAGVLDYESQQGAVMNDVPYGSLVAGEVKFISSLSLTVSDTLVVVIEGGGLSGFATMIVSSLCEENDMGRNTFCPVPHHFSVDVNPIEIVHNGSSQVFITAKTIDDEEYDLNPNQNVVVSIDNDMLGHLSFNNILSVSVNVTYDQANSGLISYIANGDVERPYYDEFVTIEAVSANISGEGNVVVDGEVEVVLCSTGNPIIDDLRVQNGLRTIWRRAYLGTGLVYRNPRNRLEYTGYIKSFLDGYNLEGVVRYNYQNPRRANHNFPTTMPGVNYLIYVHVHPFHVNELIPTEDLQALEEYESIHPSLGDEDAIELLESRLGFNVDGLVFDNEKILIFDEDGARIAEYDRCGY